jgi:hypothetical protein
MDVLADEHPTHTAALALVAIVVTALRFMLTDRYEGVLSASAVGCALVAEPGLDANSKLGRSGAAHDHGGLLHVLVTDAPVPRLPRRAAST